MAVRLTKEQIFEELKGLMIELFEVPTEKITLDAKLYDDLDLDSIDAVDMIVHMQKKTNVRFKPEDFKAVRTVKDVIDVVEKVLSTN